MATKVLLAATTTWLTSARLAEGFSRLGWEVEVLSPRGAPARKSRFTRRCHGYNPFAPLGSLSRAIARSGADLVIPCDDRALRQMLDLYARDLASGDSAASALIARSLGAPQDFETLISRADFLAAANASGIAVPATRAVGSETELIAALSDLGLPAVLKADGSWGGSGVAIVRTRVEARAAFRRMSRPLPLRRGLARALRRGDAHHFVEAWRPSPPVLSVQAFIPGKPATIAFACWQGEMLAAIPTDVVVSKSGTGPASVVACVEDPAMLAAARKLARRFGLSGLHGLDFIRDAAGAVHLLEINPRATQTSALALGEGRDLPAALAAAAAGRSVPHRAPATLGALVALFPQEWSRDRTSPYLAEGYHDVPWDDPAVLRACVAEARRPLLWGWLADIALGRTPASLPRGNHAALTSRQ